MKRSSFLLALLLAAQFAGGEVYVYTNVITSLSPGDHPLTFTQGRRVRYTVYSRTATGAAVDLSDFSVRWVIKDEIDNEIVADIDAEIRDATNGHVIVQTLLDGLDPGQYRGRLIRFLNETTPAGDIADDWITIAPSSSSMFSPTNINNVFIDQGTYILQAEISSPDGSILVDTDGTNYSLRMSRDASILENYPEYLARTDEVMIAISALFPRAGGDLLGNLGMGSNYITGAAGIAGFGSDIDFASRTTTSTNKWTNWNSDLLDGHDGAFYLDARNLTNIDGLMGMGLGYEGGRIVVTNKDSLALIFMHSGLNPAGSGGQTYYFDYHADLAPQAGGASSLRGFKLPTRYMVFAAALTPRVGGTTGVSPSTNVVISLFNKTLNTSDPLIISPDYSSAFPGPLATNGLNIILSPTNEYAIAISNPAWVTPPTTVRHVLTIFAREI